LKKRIDLLLLEKKIALNRSKAQAMIMAGQISINGKKILKSGEQIDSDSIIAVSNLHPEWVSRGAFKLLHALDHFKVNASDYVCLDLGASTGGFTEVLLSKKAKKIFSVDVGSNQLHEKLINHPKVINIAKTNARYLTKKVINEFVDIIVCDVSFISLKKVIEPSLIFLKKNGIVIALIKPQFESEKKEITRGGIIKDSKIHQRICKDIKNWFDKTSKMQVLGVEPSPLKGTKGNVEFLICAKKL
tara:strand:+ start:260 stop:994 length:735 start_codon:yes stop_codon:yes gene_type:complete